MAIKRKRNKRRKDAIDKLYDGFAKKDMTREEFRAAYMHLTSPRALRQDLSDIIHRKHEEQTNQLRIDRGLQRATNT
jgi:hypothetical protein